MGVGFWVVWWLRGFLGGGREVNIIRVVRIGACLGSGCVWFCLVK